MAVPVEVATAEMVIVLAVNPITVAPTGMPVPVIGDPIVTPTVEETFVSTSEPVVLSPVHLKPN